MTIASFYVAPVIASTGQLGATITVSGTLALSVRRITTCISTFTAKSGGVVTNSCESVALILSTCIASPPINTFGAVPSGLRKFCP